MAREYRHSLLAASIVFLLNRPTSCLDKDSLPKLTDWHCRLFRGFASKPQVIISILKKPDSGLREYPAGSATPDGYLAMRFTGKRNYASAD